MSKKGANKIADQVMDRVVQIEKRRTKRWIIGRSGLFIALGCIIVWLGAVIAKEIADRGTLDMLTVLLEDREIIGTYWKEIAATMTEELPMGKIILATGFLVILVVVVRWARKQWAVIARKSAAIRKRNQ